MNGKMHQNPIPQTSIWTISNRTFFGSLGFFVKLSVFCLPITQLSQRPISTDFRPSNSPFATNIFIPLVLMCPSLLCHRHEYEAPSATPCSGLQGSRFCATSYYHSTFHDLPRTFPKLCCISCAIQLTNKDQIFLDPKNISDILQCPLVSRGRLYAKIPLSFNL